MPYITEFIGRWKTNHAFDDPKPAYVTSVGFAPMRSTQFESIGSVGLQQLQQNFPFFMLIIYIIPFFYLTSKVAQEKESKSREGMKMMGLNDATYFLAWFILFAAISVWTALLTSTISCIGIFKKLDWFLFFVFNLLYSLTLYGWAFCIVAFVPTKKSSGIAATLINIITYFLSFAIQDPNTPSSLQYGLSIFPNICMTQMVK
jgi:ATP-binding cassette subfamily A (ABC1) protein 3